MENNTNTENLHQILQRVMKTSKMQIFHENAEIILNLMEFIPKTNDIENYFSMKEPGVILENSIIIDDKNYYCDEKLWNELHKTIVKKLELPKENKNIDKQIENIAKPEKANLNNRLHQTFQSLVESTNIMYKGVYKNILQFNNFDSYIHHLLTNYIIVEQKKANKIKRTKFDFQLALCIIRFVIEHMPNIENIYNCFDDEKSWTDLTKKEIKAILNFAETILKNNLSSIEVKTIFKSLNIIDPKLQEILYYFFDNLLYDNFKKNNITFNELHEIIKNTQRLTHTYELTSNLIKLGDFLTSYLVQEKIFEPEFIIVDYQKTHVLVPQKEIIEAIQNTYSYHKPFLIEKQIKNLKQKSKEERLYHIIHENLNKFIHSNPRINLQIKPDSYIKKGKTLYKKYGIYQNYLKFLLQYLCSNPNEIVDAICLAAIYELGTLDKLKDSILSTTTDETIANKLQAIYLFLFQELKNFNRCRSASEVFEYIKDIYKYDITLKDHKNKELTDLIHKICQRKLMLVTLINDAILLCLFESFIHTTFIDARGRYYLNAASTNIHTHLAAKLLIRLVDETYQKAPTKEALVLIKNHFKFKATRDQIDNFIAENYDINYEQENTKRMLKYIESFLKPKKEQPSNIIFDITKVLYEPLYNEPLRLLWDLGSIVKKPKRLFYVHSLLLYERERIKNKHPKHLINHYELDASSSGLQMISGLFCSINLAKMCNLISHEESQDIYSWMTEQLTATLSSVQRYFEQSAIFSRYHIFDMIEGRLDNKICASSVEYKKRVEFENLLSLWLDSQTKSEDYFKLLNKIVLDTEPYYFYMFNENTANALHNLLDSNDKALLLTLLNKYNRLDSYNYDVLDILYKDFYKLISRPHLIQNLFIFRMFVRLRRILIHDFKLNIIDFANDRELFKKAIMTYFYKSTPYGRKDDYLDYFHSHYPITASEEMKHKLNELVNFLDRYFIETLHKNIPDVDLMNQLIDNMDLTKPVTISNRNFLIYIEPRVQIKKQIQCPNLGGKRGLQLTILKPTDEIDDGKMKSMLGANIIHSMDAHIVHLLNELILNINTDLKQNKLNFKLIHDTNHDCFYFSCPFLLRVFIEECYLTCFSEKYLDNISGITEEVKQQLQKVSRDDFIKALSPIHNLFIK